MTLHDLSPDEHVADPPHGPRLPAAVLWDMDGTLVDTEPYWFAAEFDLVESFGGEWSHELARELVGFDLIDAAYFIREHGNVPLPAEEIVERLLDGVVARLHRKIPWRPGARELLADLTAAGVPCALVTMSWRRFVDPIVAALPRRTFAAIVAGDEVPPGEGKPHPTPYLVGAAACGADPRDCVAIEDSPTGMRSALAAGCRVIGVPNEVDLPDAPDAVLIDSLAGVRAVDLLELFDRPRPRTATGFDVGALLVGLRRRRRLVAALLAITVVALVGWVATSGDDAPPLPPGAVPIDAWAPYWTLGDTLRETDVRFADLREVSPFWFGARGVDQIVSDENSTIALTDDFVGRLDGSRARLVPSIRDEMPAGGMAAILADPTTRTAHVEAILRFADRLDADGIDLDYEQFAFADGSATWEATRPHWVAFVDELAARLHDDDRTLTISIPGVWNVTELGSDGYWVYDHGAIAEHADLIRIMAYDYSVAEAGPIAPLAWVEAVIAGTSAVVPEEYHDKLVLGVPSYGSNWVESTLGECPASAEGRTNITARNVEDLAARRGATPVYDPIDVEWTFAYALTVDDGATSCVQNRRVHWVDAEGVAARIELARRAGWGGVALWALGYEDDAVWQAALTASRRPLAP